MNPWPLAILFDFDGVLVNSEPLHFAAFARTVASIDIQLTETEYYAELIGFDDRGALSHLLKKYQRPHLEADYARLLKLKSDFTDAMIRGGEFGALPGVKEFVPVLAAKVPLAICSGALRREIEQMLDGIGLRHHFPVIVAAEDVAVGKPDPSGYLQCMALLSRHIGKPLLPADCLVVEDAPTVIRSVKSVGFKTLGVAGSYPMAALAEADYRVTSLEPAEVFARIGWA